MNFHQAQADLKKIVGTNEIVERLKTMENGARIHANAGVGYENYQPDSGTVIPPKEDDKPTTGADNGANKEDIENGNDTSKNADEELKVGDLLDKGLGGLFDCETGACINVNFNQDYQRKPKGWKSQCEPPNDGETQYDYYLSVREHNRYCITTGSGGKTTTKNYTVEQFKRKLLSFPEKYQRTMQDNNRQCYTGQVQTNNRNLVLNSKITIRLETLCKECTSGTKGSSEHRLYYEYKATKINSNCPDCGETGIKEWPPEKCSEIQTTKLGTAFEAACSKYDKRLPKRFQDDRFSSMELCDKDGNKVTVKRTIRGFEIKQDKYGGRTTIVDSNNYKVVGYN